MRKIVAVVIVGLLLGVGTLSAGDNPKFVFGNGQIEYLYNTVPPTVRCAGGEATGGYPPCTAETNRILTRGEAGVWKPVTLSDSVAELLDGQITFEVNCNFNSSYRGPCWGTFVWEVPGMGTWEGHWTAPVMDLVTYESEISMVGYGIGEGLNGKHLKVDGYSNPYDLYITLTVRIAK